MLETAQTTRFGPFELDARSGELRRDGTIVPLAPQPFRLLATLIGRRGAVVTREELRQSVWGETNVDFERGLNFCILQVRTALGDDARHPTYIETLPRRGYRFIAPVAERGRWRSARRGALAGAAALLLFILVAAWQQRSHQKRPMIAVLPFDNLSAPGEEHFAHGMTDELITHLGRLDPRELGVIARTSVLEYSGTTKSVRDIAGELGVQYVVEGSVRREGDRVRVTAQLIEAGSQTHLWAESFDRSAGGALAVQTEVAEKIARALRIELIDDGSSVLTSKVPAAHEAYLRGRYLWHQRDVTAVEAGVRELREATRLEPGFVLPHLALAEALHSLAMRRRVPSREAAAEIRRASDTALRLAPGHAGSHAITAMSRFWYEWDWDAAEQSYREAIRLNPSEAGALHDHGWLLMTRGRFDEGIAEIRRAQELDPVSPRANAHVAWAYIYARRFPEAVAEARRALALDPAFEEAYHCIEQAYRLSGNVAASEAIRLKRGFQSRTSDGTNAYANAVRHAYARDAEGAVQWLQKAKESGDTSFVLAGIDPKLESLHGNARFVELLESAGLEPLKPPIR